MLITFEGIDGSGKSTQIQLLKQQLNDRGLSLRVFREPGGTNLSEEIRDLLLNQDIDIQPLAETFLFSAARTQLITEKVKPLLQENVVVILDRYYDSTVAYQGYGRSAASLCELHKINEMATYNLQPDITFYLKLSLDQAENRSIGGVKDRIERSGKQFYQKVIQGFDQLAKEEERVVVVDGSKEPENIHQFIMNQMQKHFPKLCSI